MSAERSSKALARVPDKLDVVLCWHMHQPQYFDGGRREYALPWTYLHALKDYTDMAAHLEACPRARAVVNFAPILLEQIADYARRVDRALKNCVPVGDPVLDMLHMDIVPVEPDQRREIIRACLRAHAPRMIDPFPLFARLAAIGRQALEDDILLAHLDGRFFQELATCYHLAWTGETVRRARPELQGWLKAEAGFESGVRRRLLEILRDELHNVIPRYRKLAEQGRVELSFTPYAHPIMPLLQDLASAREAMPEAELPEAPAYPDGEARVRWHIERGLEVFEKHFGMRPTGCWPSEGSLSEATIRLLDEYGLRWTASGQGVLGNSLEAAGGMPDAEDNGNGNGEGEEDGPRDLQGWLHRGYRLRDTEIALYFRDDGLSDAIGFRYADWHADDAVADFVHHIGNIAEVAPAGSVVSVILDGENAWEYYPENGFHFLNGLYEALAQHERLNLCTFDDVCAHATTAGGAEPVELPGVVAGSWVYGTFSTWIGDPDKNRGWDRLIEAREAVDAAIAEDPSLDTPELREQLAICEGSDWCWWFGAYNPAGSVSDFEQLYRRHLARLYQLAGLTVPEALDEVLSVGGGDPAAGGTMRKGQD
ncbi:glycoside hydrolase family 57 protein [Thioalkalivibrio sp. ALE20]|uniref:glycoside hydrolase family 57 protein n=1 Tax=Thioalkalivibrio sp. ALE20 TaxID=545275 RepID=UPI000372FDBF|nr:glycoside hydrolase family 57 protein [Thioalkalivibrio sp. ALE20]